MSEFVTRQNTSDQFYVEWIENEGFLRDEGCITGEAPEGKEEKLRAIQAYYRFKQASVTATLEKLGAELGRLGAEITQKESEIASSDIALQAFKQTKPIRNAASWVQAVFMLFILAVTTISNFFLVGFLVRGFSPSWWLPIAIMGVGMFILFGSSTVWSNSAGAENIADSDNRLRWLIEIVPPIAAAAFVGCLSFYRHPLLIAISGAAFVLILFLFCGKLIIHLNNTLNAVFVTYREYSLRAKEYDEKERTLSDRIKEQKEYLYNLKKRAEEELPEEIRKQREQKIAFEEESEVKQAIFLSEYQFGYAINKNRHSYQQS